MEGDIFDTLKNEFNIEEEKAEAVSESPKYIQKVEEKLKEINKNAKEYLSENENATQKEIADSLNISRSYVSRIEKRALGKQQYHTSTLKEVLDQLDDEVFGLMEYRTNSRL